jgi:hypothetical protein
MPLLGTAAIAIWIEIDDDKRFAHDHWHSFEHLSERLGIPGFLRGRRCSAPGGHFVLYELKDLAVATSAPYLERLNNPSTWTQKVMPDVRLARALCRIVSSRGIGLAGAVSTVRCRQEPQVSAMELSPGVTGIHLLQRDAATVRPKTNEEKLRLGGGDGSADWVLVVEGWDAGAVAQAVTSVQLPDAIVGHYTLAHTLTS